MACSCNKDIRAGTSQKYIDGRCPLKAYSLNCTEYGSSCLDKQCEDENKRCGRDRQVIRAVVYCAPNSEPNLNNHSTGQSTSKMAPCCDSCSEGGPCDDTRRTEIKKRTRTTSSEKCCSNCKCVEDFKGKAQQRTDKISCGSYCNGGPCKDNHKDTKQRANEKCCVSYRGGGSSEHKKSQQRTNKSCCDSCCSGCFCGEDCKCQTQQRRKKACCDSCCNGCSCGEDCKCQTQQRKKKDCCDSCSSGGPCEDVESASRNRRVKYRAIGAMPFRQCGVVSNYMGFIPGLQMTFGQTYGVTANRLLERHFSEQEKKN